MTHTSPDGLAQRLVRGLQRARGPVLALALALTALAGWAASRIGVDNAVEVWFLDDDPALVRYHTFQETFGNDEVVVIAVAPEEGVLSPEGLTLLREIDARLLAIEGVADVQSLTATVGAAGEGGVLDIRPAVPEDAADITPEVAAQVRARVAADPLLSRLVSEDGAAALVLARMDAMDDIDARRDGILTEMRGALAALTEARLAYAGIGVIYAALNEASTQGAVGFIAASYALIALLLWGLLGRLGPMLLSLAAVGGGAVWLLGAYGAAGRDINMVTMVLPTLVLVIGVSSCVHMLVHVTEQDPAAPQAERAVAGISAVLWPCLFNTLTTCMGFLALSTAAMPVIRDLGVFGALGVAAAFVAGLLLCATLAAAPFFQPVLRRTGLLQRAVDALADVAVTRSRAVLVAACFAGLVAALGITRIQVDTFSIDFLRQSHPVRQDSDLIEAQFGPYTPLELVITSAELPVDSPEVLSAIARWQDRMEQRDDVGWSHSAADVVRRLNQVLTDGSEAQYAVPADPIALEQLLFLYRSHPDSDLDTLLVGDAGLARVTVGIPMGSARSFQQTIDALTALAELPPGVSVQASGYLPLYVRMMDHIVRSQLSSFGLAFLIIFALVGLLFRSLRLAALAIPANLLPVLLTLGLMGLLGIRLDVATVTIAAIVLGLVVDDTVQFLYRYSRERAQTDSEAEAVHRAIRIVGRPMAITTVVLSLGFCVLGLAAVKSVAWFGLLLAFALVTALASDLLVIPALLVVLGEEDREDALTDPQPGGR